MKKLIIIITAIFFSALVAAAVIEVNSEPAESSITIEEFGDQNILTCIVNDFNNDGIEEGVWHLGNTPSSNTKCNQIGVNEVGLPITSCCASGLACNAVSGNCESTPLILTSCSNFTTKETCEPINGVNPEIIKNSIYTQISETTGVKIEDMNDFCTGDNIFQYRSGNECTDVIGPCTCFWKDSNSECKSRYSIDVNACEPENRIRFICETTDGGLQDLCDSDGYYLYSWTAQIVDESGQPISGLTDPFCESGNKPFACPFSQESEELPFFTLTSAIISLLIILIIYCLFHRRNNERY